MTHVHIPDGGGAWAIAVDGGRKRVLGLFSAANAGEDALSRKDLEAVARLIVVALDTPGGIESAIRAIAKPYPEEPQPC